MNIHKRTVFGLRAVPIVALAVAVLLNWGFGMANHARADQPHPGLQFHIGVDTNGDNVDDCSTVGNVPGFCGVPQGNTFVVNAYLDSKGTLPNYDGVTVWEDYTGVTSKGVTNSDADPWPDCALTGIVALPGYTAVGCAIGVGAPSSTYTGKVTTATYTCTADGTITLNHGYTELVSSLVSHRELGPDALNIRCSGPAVGGVSLDPTQLPPGGSAGYGAALLAALVAGAITTIGGAAWWARRRGNHIP